MEKPIITIGREYGAGGHTVAKALSQQLGIPAYDKEIIKITAEEEWPDGVDPSTHGGERRPGEPDQLVFAQRRAFLL